MIPVLVFTSDKYLDALRPFAYLFNRYWGAEQKVTVIGFAKPDFYLPENFAFHSMGDMANYPVNRWSNAVLDYLALRNDISHFILMLEDYWLTRSVDVRAVKMLYDYAQQFSYVLKIDLCGDRLYAAGMSDYGVCGRLDLIKSDYTSQYHMSLMTGIWNKRLFQTFVYPNETPWEVELNGTPRVAVVKDDILVLGTRQWPVRHILAHRNGKTDRVHYEGLSLEDWEVVRQLYYGESIPEGN